MIRWSMVISVLIVILLTPYIMLAEAGDILWTTILSDEIYESTPAIGENIYIGSIDHHLYSITPNTGEENWSVDLGLPILMSPTILENGNILCASKTDSLYCISPTGETIWKKDLLDDVINCAIINSDEFLVGIENGNIFKMDIYGTILHTYYTPLEISKGPFITADGSVILIGEDYSINVYNSSLSLIWEDEAERNIPPTIVGNVIYYRSGNYLKMKTTNGEDILSDHDFDSDSGPGDLVDFEGNRYVTFYNRIKKYSPSGSLIWQFYPESTINGYPVLTDQGDIYLATNDNEVIHLNNSGEFQWSCQIPNRTNSGLKLDNSGNLIVACRFGELVCIETNGEPIAPWGYSSLGCDLSNSFSKKAVLYANTNAITNYFALTGETYRDTVTIYNSSDSGELLETEVNNDLIEINILGSNIVAANDSVQIEINFSSELLAYLDGEILVKSLFSGTVFPISYKASADNLGNGSVLSYSSFPGYEGLSLPTLLNDELVLVNLEHSKTIAFDLNGNELWSINAYIQDHPIALANGNFILTYSSFIRCYDSEANELWQYDCPQDSYISADSESNTFIGNSNHIQKINRDGDLVWEYDCNSINLRGNIAIAPDGTLYFTNMAKQITALSAEGILKHKIQLENYAYDLAIDHEGYIYASCSSSRKLFCFDPAGNYVSDYHFSSGGLYPPLVDNNYVYIKNGSILRKFDRITLDIAYTSPDSFDMVSQNLTIDSNGKYFLTGHEENQNSQLTAINSNNSIDWQFDPSEFNLCGSPNGAPLILPNGNIVVSANSLNGSTLLFFNESVNASDNTWSTTGANVKRNYSLPLAPETGANLCLYEDFLDFGVVEVDTEYELSIMLYNTGVEDLEISIDSNSDIFSAIPGYETYIAHQDSLLLVVTCYIPEAQSGIYSDEIIINTNDDDFPRKVINCNAKSNSEGELLWIYEDGSDGNPALDVFGNIYLLDNGSVVSINPEGTLNWETNLYRNYLSCKNVTINNNNSTIIAPPATTLNMQGNPLEEFTNLQFHTETSLNSQDDLIFGSSRISEPGIYSYSATGIENWFNEDIDRLVDAIVIDELDRLYFHTQGDGSLNNFYCFDSNGNEIWLRELDTGFCNPAIGYDHKLYYTYRNPSLQDNLMLVCLGYEGNVLWECNLPDDRAFVAPVINNQGNIYQACDNGKICSVSEDGEILWIYDVNSWITTPAIGANGCIYFGAGNSNLYALNPDGSLRWTLETSDPVSSCITISPEGVLYFTDSSERLYAVSSECGGLADSPWPMMHQNPQHTNRLPHEYQTSLNEIIDIPQTTICNYPNPFNPETTMTFSLPTAVNVNLEIYNVKGQMVKSIYAGKMEKGEHNLKWNGLDESNNSVSSGVYFYQLSTTDECIRGKMLLMK